MIQVAFITDKDNPSLTSDDRLLMKPLSRAGIDVRPVVWENRNINWKQYQTAVFRSCWNYYKNTDKFRQFLNSIKKAKILVWNPLETVSGNIDKKYLLDLKKIEINTVPTLVSSRQISENIDFFNYFSSEEIVVKPAIGASGYSVVKFSLSEKNKLRQYFSKEFKSKDYLIQPYFPQIEKPGELSIIFIGNKFSHCIRKLPKRGDFRTGYNFGAGWRSEKLLPQLKLQAEDMIDKLNKDLLYARIDALEVDGKLMLMELEVFEPFMFFAWHKPSVEQFARSLASRIRSMPLS